MSCLFMSYKKNNPAAILIATSAIALALVTTTSFNHSYTAFAAAKKDGGGSNSHANGVTTLGGRTTATTTLGGRTATNTPNTNSLTKKELSSFISCINMANRSQGLTHKVVTNCLDTAKGITPASSTTTASAATSSSPSSIAPTAIPRA
jgi:hypothetical protein